MLVTPPLLLAAGTTSGAPPATVRFATFNASLNRAVHYGSLAAPTPGSALADFLAPFNPAEPDLALRQRRNQAANVAEVIQRVRPEILLINELDYVEGPIDGNAATDAFQANYLAVSQNGAVPIDYPHVFVAPSNTGISSGKDLDNNGQVVTTPGSGLYGNDSFGFGEFPGKFGMAVFSMYPIDYASARTFQTFLWKDMPGALLPHYPDPFPANPALAGQPWYSPDELEIFRLSSKSHWDVPIQISGTTIHFLASHPTPPVFDGLEDRNGTRNHDEIRFWADYIHPTRGAYIYDDAGVHGGLTPGAYFVIAGDQNSDPLDGDSIPGAIQQLIEHPLVNASVTPSSPGAVQQAALQGGANATHRSDPAFDTADFADAAPGNLRADYVLPRKSLRITDAAVFWPLNTDPLFRLVGTFSFAEWGLVGGFPTSDHRLVWVDVRIPAVSGG
jgi:3-phytase